MQPKKLIYLAPDLDPGIDLSAFKLHDLTHPWSAAAVPFMGYPSPKVSYLFRKPTNRIYAQYVETAMHVGTHMDAPIHWLGPGAADMASVPLDTLYGEGVIVDISDICSDWYTYTSEDVRKRVTVKKGDILIIKTGYQKYYLSDEERYMCKHPGPGKEFADWAVKMKLRWIGVDTASADHPMNTNYIPAFRPDLRAEFESKRGMKLDEVFPRERVHPMHEIFRYGLIHAENVGGDLEKLSSMRCTIGAFPWRFVGGEASICRIVAFEPTK